MAGTPEATKRSYPDADSRGNSHSAACIHCGTPVPTDRGASTFCCTGCEYVYNLIQDKGLDHYYALRDRQISPVSGFVFHERDYTWLQDLATEAAANSSGDVAQARFSLQGISCIGCVWLIERIFHEEPGGLRLRIDPASGNLEATWNPAVFDIVAFAKHVQRFGYLLGPPSRETAREVSGIVLRIGVCAAFALNAMLFTLPRYLGMAEDFQFAGLFETLSALFATLGVAVGGSFFIGRAVSALQRKMLHIDMPIALGITLAYLGSLAGWVFGVPSLIYFDFVCIFIFLMLVGRWLQVKSVERNRRQLSALSFQERSITLEDGQAKPVTELAAGDAYTLRRGEAAPVSSRLTNDAAASISLESINGESDPVAWNPLRPLPSGAVNISSAPIALTALEGWSGSMMDQLTASTCAAESGNPLVERIMRIYVAAVLVIAVLGGGAWLVFGSDPFQALQVAISVLVVSCPCALGVALPLADELTAGNLMRRGIFVRAYDLWGRLRRVSQIAFDKTGTLTMETPSLMNPEAIANLSPGDRQTLFALVATSLHPVSRALREYLLANAPGDLDNGPDSSQTNAAEEIPGYGVRLSSGGHTYSIGRPGWTGAGSGETLPEPTPADQSAVTDSADCELRRDGKLLARFRFTDNIRPDARDELADLAARGYALAILSGDRQAKVDAITRALSFGSSPALGGLSPADKATWLEANGADRTLFVGDGLNDSIACDVALCSGTPVADKGALEHKADFYFLSQGISALRILIHAAGQRVRCGRIMFAFSLTYNVVAVSACLAGLMTPLIAAIVMPISSAVTIAIAGGSIRE